MPRVTIRDVGSIGVVLDIPGHELPPEAWTQVKNVVFLNKSATRALGETDVFAPPSVVPYYLMASPSVTDPFWVYTNCAKVFCVSGSTHIDITRVAGDYTGGLFARWNGDWINGVLVLNNGVDVPQQWLPIAGGTPLVALANWPAATTAKVIRKFQNFIMAMDVVKAGVRYPTMVKWGHPADPGSVPVTWDPDDTTKLAGELPMSDTAGFILDGLTLGGSFMVYKEDAIHRMDRVATNSVFSQRMISGTGIMGQKCVVEFEFGKHVMLTNSADVVVVDGQRVVGSVIDKVNRIALEKRMDGTNRARAVVTVNDALKEVYIAYPLVNSEYCNEVAVWNWVDGTWSFKDITPTLDLSQGIYDEAASSNIIDDDDRVIDTVDEVIDQRQFASAGHKILGAFPTVNAIRQVARGQKLGPTVTYGSLLERTGLSIVGYGRDGSPRNDPNVVKQVTELYPLMEGLDPDVVMEISVGAQDRPDGPVTWDGPYLFDPATMEKVDPFIEGRYIGVRFRSDSEKEWKLRAYGLQMNLVGEYL